MPKTRQVPESATDYALGAPTGAGVLPHGFQIDAHVHADGLLVYAVSGVVATVTERGTWVAPASRIIWTPPGFEHAHRFYGETDVRVVDVPLTACGALPPEPGVFTVSPLLREALLALTDLPETRAGAHDRLREVVVDELVEAPDRSIRLPEPQDDRLHAVTAILHADPAEPATLAHLGRRVGASERTLSRLFHRELGMSFHQWRTVLRIHHALLHLGEGMSVIDTATTCGWANPTSFIEAFSAIVGQTPGRYQSELRDRAR
ncbi:MAG: helix-turn-helix transcriptional regulator [Arachnia sp.]